MHSNSDISEFVAYLGWNIGYVILLLLTIHMCKKDSRRYFRPLILWPVLTNIIQFFLYIQFGGIWNNLFQVAMTSMRSYRGIMPQEKVREEIEKGIGTQFDPQFAKIMLQMMADDADYTMRETEIPETASS